MVAVGFAAPAAMSHNIIINNIEYFAALFLQQLLFYLCLFKLQ